MEANPDYHTSTIAAARHESAEYIKAATEELSAAVKDFVTQGGDFSDNVDKVQRQTIIDAAQRIMDSVKRPDHRWHDFGQMTALYASAQLFYEWGAFEAIPVEGSITYQELAAQTDTEEALLSKI